MDSDHADADNQHDAEAIPPPFLSESEPLEAELDDSPADIDAPARPRRSRFVIAVVAAAFLLAIVIVVFVALSTATTGMSARGAAPQQRVYETDRAANFDDGDIIGQEQQKEEMQPSDTVDEWPETEDDLEEAPYAEEDERQDEVTAPDPFDEDDDVEASLLPEDCDHDGCDASIEDELSVHLGPISDFAVTNMTRIANAVANNVQSANNGGNIVGSYSTSSTGRNNDNNNGNKCSNPNDQGYVLLTLDTDRYPWETSWEIIKTSDNESFASGPPPNKNYNRRTRYVGQLCLPVGDYVLKMMDSIGDGICCEHGRGRARVTVNGSRRRVSTGNESYKVKRYPFAVTPERADAVTDDGSINNGKECSLLTPIDYTKKFQHGSGYAGFPGFQCYRTVDGTKQTVDDLLSKYPRLASKVELNYPTAERKLRLYALVITNNQSNREKGKMMTISSIHGREIATGELMVRFAEYLLQNYGKDPDVTWILDHTEIHIIPHANPDARIYLENGGENSGWKKNRNPACKVAGWRYGVDPNRNFPFKWGKCSAADGSQRCSGSADCESIVYRGPSAKSEQESKAIVEYAASIFPVQQRKGNLKKSERNSNSPFSTSSEGVFLDIHSYGRLIGWPWGFKNELSPNDDGLGALGRKMASFSGYKLWAPQMPNRKYGFDGGTIDTMYGWLGAASFFFELGTAFSQPCSAFPTIINEVFPALLYAAKVAKQPYIAPRGPDILCTTITSTREGNYVNVRMGVSDNSRTSHADDGGRLFSTGRQNVRLVEIFVNCHPFIASCRPAATRSLPSAGRSATTSLEFKAPTGRTKNVMYVRATDSGQFTGPITARNFIV